MICLRNETELRQANRGRRAKKKCHQNAYFEVATILFTTGFQLPVFTILWCFFSLLINQTHFRLKTASVRVSKVYNTKRNLILHMHIETSLCLSVKYRSISVCFWDPLRLSETTCLTQSNTAAFLFLFLFLGPLTTV